MLKKDKIILQDFSEAIKHEWLETNGLGGWSSSSIIHANTRRYHGLLVAATNPPAERTVLLSKLDETIVLNEKRIELGSNLYDGDVVHPAGNQFLKSFTKELFPEWVYEIEGVQLKKTIAMIHEENTVVVLYEVIKATKKFTLELLPLMAGRFYHVMQHEGPQMHWDVDFNDGIFHNQPDGNLNLYINVPGSTYTHAPRWFKNFKYSVEAYRGLDYTEDLFNHGVITVQLKKGDSIGIIISTEDPSGRDAQALLTKESLRRQELLNEQPQDETLQQLVLAADQFIVKRGDNLKTVIAGYHWFTDWGRDTMISLPGLCLSTGRFEDAKKILSAFANSVSMGMLPNRFQDNNEPPEYNNVDGTLWYFVAAYKYLQVSNDKKFILNEILPVLKEIIDWHFKGTRYNIHVDDDGLLYAGEIGQQLTWMDARIGSWVVTPRMGKPVEIEALWYNALKIFAALLRMNKQKSDAAKIEAVAAKVKESFEKLFWYAEGKYFYDVIDENEKPNAELRPNQLFAISLPFALLEDDKAKNVLQVVTEKLYTPVGLRSLPANDIHYVHHYGGDQWHRDSSYHEGTVWSWLLGAYVDAVVKVYGAKGKAKAKQIINNFKFHLNEGCIGSVSEIFDADAPHHPRGCIAQAWGVAEVLRVIKNYELYKAPTAKTKKN
ncbi:amylo-alpha-1,6-glucosidase [Ferruginibacter sp. SUN106]|uniref:amylo-alpha-1,6-glucosidase n=1 Tax=Ferruginibacter sp. SUN106 TaxID=2978348 RepID=UPI003D3651D9